MKINQRGNVLFIIMVTVVLFGALTFAVTQSGRGGSSGEREQAELWATEIAQEAERMRTRIQRLRTIGGYDQVLFDDSDPDQNGTCYNGNTAITPCRTVGLFSETGGLNAPPLWKNEYRDPDQISENRTWLWGSRRLQIDGVDVGTAEPDIYFLLLSIKPAICRAINRNMNGSSEIGTSDDGGGGGFTYVAFNENGTKWIANGGSGRQINRRGCIDLGDNRYTALFVIEAR